MQRSKPELIRALKKSGGKHFAYFSEEQWNDVAAIAKGFAKQAGNEMPSLEQGKVALRAREVQGLYGKEALEAVMKIAQAKAAEDGKKYPHMQHLKAAEPYLDELLSTEREIRQISESEIDSESPGFSAGLRNGHRDERTGKQAIVRGRV